LHYVNITYGHIHFAVCAQCNIIMTPESVYITAMFSTLLLMKGLSSVLALD